MLEGALIQWLKANRLVNRSVLNEKYLAVSELNAATEAKERLDGYDPAEEKPDDNGMYGDGFIVQGNGDRDEDGHKADGKQREVRQKAHREMVRISVDFAAAAAERVALRADSKMIRQTEAISKLVDFLPSLQVRVCPRS